LFAIFNALYQMKERYFSLDVFRGATVAFMIMVNNQAGTAYAPLEHAAWHGITPTDAVFPFFLFAVGNALSFVAPRYKHNPNLFVKKVIKRSLLIFLIGLLLNWSPFVRWNNQQLVWKGWEWINTNGTVSGIRIMGVLQRIALCYLFASLLVYFFKPKTVFLISIGILLLYWWLCAALGSPSSDPYSLQGYFGTAIDKNIFGEAHMYHGEGVAFDPEGLASTLPAITQVVFGFLTGSYIQQKGKNYEMLSHVCLSGIVFLFIGYCWNFFFPINKKIWTSSYVIYTTGLAILTLAVLIFLIEFKHKTGWWTSFCNVFGKNPLFIFVLSGFIPRVVSLIRIPHTTAAGKEESISPLGWLFEHICKPLFTDLRAASLFYSVLLIIFYWLIGYWLDKKKIYIKV
jgi:predicted acyltransferase